MGLSLIVARASNGVIGVNNQLPWHLPEDLKYFKSVTMGKPIVMGRKTYDSIGRPLPGRQNIVVSRNPELSIEGVDVVASIPAAIEAAGDVPEVMMIGGTQLYQQALDFADKVYLTEIHQDFVGDAYFPELPNVWVEQSRESHVSAEDLQYSFCVYKK